MSLPASAAAVFRRVEGKLPRGWPVLLGSAVGFAVGLGLVLRPGPSLPAHIRLLGIELPSASAAEAVALDRLRQHTSASFVLELPDQASRTVSYAEMGVVIDTLRAAQLARDAFDLTSPLTKTRARQRRQPDLELPPALGLDPLKAVPFLLQLKDEIDRPALDASIDLTLKTVRAERSGALLDLDASLEAIRAALRAGASRAKLVVQPLEPARRAADLTTVRYDHVLASFETPYDRSEQSQARTFNLQLAASKLDGTVLLPGEEFDFNQVVGPRDEASGYKVAPVIAQGELVDGIGGGTCQISGTLHGAAFFAGLDIVERFPHTRPSSYIKMGLDAAVVYPTINLRLRNPFEFAVVLHAVVAQGTVKMQVLGPQSRGAVTLIRRIDAVIPYDELTRPDPKLPRGSRVLVQRGIPGFRLHRYRIEREGRHAVRERWDEIYPPTTQIVALGTAAPSRKDRQPVGDPHLEYLADELLIMTHATEKSGPTIRTKREAGRYGRPGWTAQAGMPVWNAADGR